jgi:hypothetical protein
MKSIVLLAAVALLSAVVGPLTAFAEDAPPTAVVTPVGKLGCVRAQLLERPVWTTSGAWRNEGAELLLADAFTHRLLRYTADGRTLGALPGPVGAAIANLAPTMLKADETTGELLALIRGEEGYGLLSVAAGRRGAAGPGQTSVATAKTGPPLQTYALESSSRNAKGERFAGMFQWEPVGRDVVTASDIQGPGENQWMGGIVRFPRDRPTEFKPLASFGRHDAERDFYRLGYPYIAALGNTAYVLRMTNVPGLFEDRPDNGAKTDYLVAVADPLPDLNNSNSQLNPQLPSYRTREDFVTLMAAVERSTMPAGLYGWQGHLYVLSRSPDGSGGSAWKLLKLKVESREPHAVPIAAATLPTKAHHLTVIPGPRFWAFVEKGRVVKYGVQDIETILFVPSPLLGEKMTAANVCGSEAP